LALTISNNRNEAERSPGRIAATPDPDYFLEEFVNPSRICWILDLTILIEELGNFREIPVPESAHQTKLAQDRQQTLDHARAAKIAGGNAADSDRFVDDVFFQSWNRGRASAARENCDCIPAEQARHRRRGKRARKTMVFQGLTRVGCPDLQCPNIHVLRLDDRLFRHFAEDKRNVLAHSALARAVPRTTGIKSRPNCAVG